MGLPCLNGSGSLRVLAGTSHSGHTCLNRLNVQVTRSQRDTARAPGTATRLRGGPGWKFPPAKRHSRHLGENNLLLYLRDCME